MNFIKRLFPFFQKKTTEKFTFPKPTNEYLSAREGTFDKNYFGQKEFLSAFVVSFIQPHFRQEVKINFSCYLPHMKTSTSSLTTKGIFRKLAK